MASLPIGTLVADETDQLALVWQCVRGTVLGLPIRYLKRPRRRTDVLLVGEELSKVLGVPSKATMVIETHHRVVIAASCRITGEVPMSLLARTELTIQRAKQADADEHRARMLV